MVRTDTDGRFRDRHPPGAYRQIDVGEVELVDGRTGEDALARAALSAGAVTRRAVRLVDLAASDVQVDVGILILGGDRLSAQRGGQERKRADQ
jgi:hypothetical protein